ncbi:AraC family ligand binding domain-containing protein, partial [Paenibacillus sp. TAF58]
MATHKDNFTTAWSEDSIRFISSPSLFAKSTLYYVQEIGHFRTLPGYFTEREHLDSYLIVYTIKGKGRLKYKEKTFILLPLQVF